MKTFFNRLIYIIYSWGAYILLFAIYRFAFLVTYANADVWREKYGIFKAFFVGAQFDTRVITILLLPILLLSIAELFLRKQHWNWRKIYAIINTVFFIFAAISLTIDFFYYSFFQSHIDVLVFGLIDDDTSEVLKSVWTDFPVIRVVLLLVLLTYGTYKLFRLFFRTNLARKINLKAYSFIPFLLVYIVVFFYGLRGSFSTFPLQMDDSTISKNPFVNQLTLNGIYTFQQGLKQYGKNKMKRDPQEYLRANNLNLQNLVADFLQIDVSSINANDPLSALTFTTSSGNSSERDKPHVVVLQMESMGTIYWEHHSEELNLLGELADVVDYCYVFKNFMPSSNGTIPTLEHFVTQTPIASVAQSTSYSILFSTATALPFLHNNYQTSFVTSAKLGWRNINKYLPAQGFQFVEGRELILATNPNAQESGWGVFDEYMFDRIFEKLEKSNTFQYIFGMSATNHTPYELPENYNVLPITINDSIRKLIKPTIDTKSVTEKNFQTYQYACNALGNFIKKIKNSPLGENTIVIASGDHNCRQSFNFDDAQMYWTYSVPMIAYIPQKYIAQKDINTQQWASHGDIFPTVYNLALPNTSYIKLGRDIINDTTVPYALNAGHRIFSTVGAYDANADLYFQWRASNYLSPDADLVNNLEMQKINKSARAIQHLKTYLEYENMSKKK